ncbi:hypothetical protein B0A55_05427 [Friedmanniomyces simplex]|uniref:Uncharacterized protein n=1 Tax=Friedmanniomyces simplex TaxID=329884 RepID=A0A4U0XC35_9PEZI|nr:hypothetical protein B0A55_05427 [Friedmanniomyces simplex]
MGCFPSKPDDLSGQPSAYHPISYRARPMETSALDGAWGSRRRPRRRGHGHRGGAGGAGGIGGIMVVVVAEEAEVEVEGDVESGLRRWYWLLGSFFRGVCSGYMLAGLAEL